MRIRLIYALGLVLAAFTLSAVSQTPQSSPCLNADDVKAFRQALADRDFYKQRAENAEAMITAITASRDQWKALYEAEKVRADTIQGGRIGQLQAALDLAKVQMDADRQKIGELNADIIRLKSSRKWYALLGAGAGFAGGYFIGNKAGTSGGITNILNPPANRPAFRF